MPQSGTIGIIGGGQLGRMLTEAAIALGFQVTVLDPVADSPAAQSGASQIVKAYGEASINELASQTDYLTTEFEEGLDPKILDNLAIKGVKLNPEPQTVAIILDKYKQKNYLSSRGVAMGEYAAIKDQKEAYSLLEKFGGKMVIKTRRGGYDGYGNRVVDSREGVNRALEDFKGKALYAEKFVPYQKELAVIAVRGQDGTIITYPVVETIQKNNICHEVLAPAAVKEDAEEKATAMARQVAGIFGGAGAFGIEMFLTRDGQVWLNEVAPRVHNSGHYTIEA